jgi:hypothetical protein
MSMTGRAHTLFWFVALFWCASNLACASGASCPDNTVPIGSYNVAYAAVDAGDTCVVGYLPDGGPTRYDLITTPTASTMLLCATPADAGATSLYLAGLPLGAPDAGLYTSTGGNTNVTGSACLCAVDIGDTFTVTFPTLDGGAFAYVDGGAPALPKFTARIDYALVHNSGDTNACACNTPCGSHFAIAGSQ